MGFVLLTPIAASIMLAAGARTAVNARTWKTAAVAALLCICGPACVPALAALDPANTDGITSDPAIFLVIVIQAGDVMQYIAGKLAGRRPLAPRLSPGKTIEGAIGGIVGAGLLGALLAPLTPYNPIAAAGIACLLTLFGITGGLLLSAQKRQRGIKDWGDLIPGHGGMLDRLDSLCLSAPVFYFTLAVGWVSAA
jgi:phosphatidate cytidylyltransferase